MAEIAPDRTCVLTTSGPGGGALLGRHRVTIEARRIIHTISGNESGSEDFGGSGPPLVTWFVPEEYSRSDTLPLTAEVNKGDNKIDFDLPINGG
ncbi:MAG: hypothetical protein JW959_02060 [Pirellulales bacterium]|nr:hypothetical protein [Pirellulales bacterium]